MTLIHAIKLPKNKVSENLKLLVPKSDNILSHPLLKSPTIFPATAFCPKLLNTTPLKCD